MPPNPKLMPAHHHQSTGLLGQTQVQETLSPIPPWLVIDFYQFMLMLTTLAIFKKPLANQPPNSPNVSCKTMWLSMCTTLRQCCVALANWNQALNILSQKRVASMKVTHPRCLHFHLSRHQQVNHLLQELSQSPHHLWILFWGVRLLRGLPRYPPLEYRHRSHQGRRDTTLYWLESVQGSIMTTGKPTTFTAIIAHLFIFPLPGRMLNPLFTKFLMLVTSPFQLMCRQSSFILGPKSLEGLELLEILATMRSMAPGKMGFSSFLFDLLQF